MVNIQRHIWLNQNSIKSSKQHKAHSTQPPSIHLAGAEEKGGGPETFTVLELTDFCSWTVSWRSTPTTERKTLSVPEALVLNSGIKLRHFYNDIIFTRRRRTHLAGFVCLGVKDAVTEPQAGLLADLLQVRPHGFWKRTLTLLLWQGLRFPWQRGYLWEGVFLAHLVRKQCEDGCCDIKSGCKTAGVHHLHAAGGEAVGGCWRGAGIDPVVRSLSDNSLHQTSHYWFQAWSKCCFSPSSCLLAGLTYIALRGKPGSPGMGKLVIPRVYISFSPWLLELHCEETIQMLGSRTQHALFCVWVLTHLM